MAGGPPAVRHPGRGYICFGRLYPLLNLLPDKTILPAGCNAYLPAPQEIFGGMETEDLTAINEADYVASRTYLFRMTKPSSMCG